MNEIRLLFGLMLVMLCSAGFADAIYRWVDDRGKTHYSQSKPLNYEFIVIEAPPPPPGNSPDLNKPFSEQINARIKARTEASRRKEKKISESGKDNNECEVARNNMSKLQAAIRVSYRNEAGDIVYLDDDTRNTKLEETRKYIEYFCE